MIQEGQRDGSFLKSKDGSVMRKGCSSTITGGERRDGFGSRRWKVWKLEMRVHR